MQYAKVITPRREALVALELTNQGASWQNLFDRTDTSGYEVWLPESHNMFRNPFQNANEQRYNTWHFAEVFHDIIREGGKGIDTKGRLHLIYVSHASTQWEKEHRVWAPRNGWWVPTADGVFYPGTLTPFETLRAKPRAIKRLEKYGIPTDYISSYQRYDSYKDEGAKVVVRWFWPGILCWAGRFAVEDRPFSGSKDHYFASRPRCKNPEEAEVVMEVTAA